MTALKTEKAPMEILVIEDDLVIGRAVERWCLEATHHCNWAKDGSRGKELAQSQKFDAIILDLMLPGESGLNVLKDLRKSGIRTPIIILTALGSVEERVAGLNAGADDYVVKPFALIELMARLEAVCRRATDRPQAEIKVGRLTLDLATRTLTCGDAELPLTRTEFRLLEMLMRYAGQVVTRKMLCEHIWESDWEGTTNVLEVYINRLRNKMQHANVTDMIQTVRGRGYILRLS
jgi:two-component system, OmpR family, response regulator